MKKLLMLAVMILCIAVSLTARENSSYFLRPAFDPLPQSFGSNMRQDLLSTTLSQSYLVTSETWENTWKMTAEFNDLNQATSFTVWAWQGTFEEWVAMDRMASIQYRPDGRPLSSIIQQWTGSSWHTYGDINYQYENDLLMHVRYDWYIDGQPRPYWHLYYQYHPNTNILDKTVELWFNENQMPFVRKYDFTWYCGNQPTQIDESVLDRFGEWGLIRHTFEYRDEDQTSHASYMRRLEFGWPFYTDMVPGLQPVKLQQQRCFVQSPSGIPERHRYLFEYDDGNQLTHKRFYDRDTNPPWSQTREYVYEYEDGLQVLETYYDTYPDRIDYLPRTRDFKYYTQTSSMDDPGSPELAIDLKVSPNPFKPETRISYKLAAAATTQLTVYNIKGQKVRALLAESKSAGSHVLTWNGKDENGKPMPAGVYVISLNAGGQTRRVKAVLK